MDPPTSSSASSGIKFDGPVTPKSKNTNYIPRSSPRPPFSTENSPHKYYATKNSPISQRSSAIPLHRSRNVAKIIKGEIHNVLTVMRSDPRYYTTGSDGNIAARSRFEYEERQYVTGMGRFWSSSGSSASNSHSVMMRDSSNKNLSTAMGSFSAHPILQGLRDLHDVLSSMDSEFYDGNPNIPLNAQTFVSPFAAAVCSADIDAKTTGAALSALHKFIVYGFLEGRSSSSDAAESITTVARCIQNCSFEETHKKASGSRKGTLSFWSTEKKYEQKKPGAFVINQQATSSENDQKIKVENEMNLPQFLIHPKHRHASKGSSSGATKYDILSSVEQNVVLKLLSLSVQVLRCPAGRSFLSPSDIVGIFDTCLFVSLTSENAQHSLLQSAAADALSHCVMVVFGIRPGYTTAESNQTPEGRRNETLLDDETHPTTEDASNSDDEWGDRDPGQDVEGSFLFQRHETIKSPVDKEKTPADGVYFKTKATQLEEINTGDEQPALVAIMARLAAMADPLIHKDDTCVLSLSLINMALETMNDADALASKYSRLLSIMQNDLCRNLLRLSTSADLTLLGLALRVIFNLFNGIKHHMKLQLEVFLTSIHLKMLSSSSPEHVELALESLLEFCREPMLMHDLYLNYDCDINCTNLFETICLSLSKVANPDEEDFAEQNQRDGDGSSVVVHQKPRLNILNRLAVEGIIAVTGSISKRCRSSKFPMIPFSIEGSLPEDTKPSPPDSGNSGILGNTLCINNVGASETQGYDFCSLSSSSDFATPDKKVNHPNARTNSDISDADFEILSKTGHHASLALRERKIQKRRLAKATNAFNESSRDKEWIEELERLGVVPSPATPESVAYFLHTASEKLDKPKIGEYISKGPKDKYPFIQEVLREFTQLFDFSGMSFSESLRLYLSSFRLPGEAQCIDRLMEAFAQRLYEGHASQHDDNAEKTMLDPPREGENNSRSGLLDPPTSDDNANALPFRSADAAFILAFSTIMLNTDLHNPNMDDTKRMTLEQFIRNNRGINDSEDLPTQFLEELYYDIKNNEIQMKKDCDGIEDFDGLLVERANVSLPFFTAHGSSIQAGVHERDMFLAISMATTRAMATVFAQSWDDALVMKALNGLKSSAHICAYFGLSQELDEIIDLLLSWGQDYISSIHRILTAEGSTKLRNDSIQSNVVQSESHKGTTLDAAHLEADLIALDLPLLPASFVSSLNSGINIDHNFSPSSTDVAGSAAHRGLLSLHCALLLCKHHLSIVNESLPALLEVVFALRDVKALPPRLGDLDDFADSKGNSLPPSVFATKSLARVNEYRESLSESIPSNAVPSTGLFSFLGFGNASSHELTPSHSLNTNPLIRVLEVVSSEASLDQIIMKMNDVNMAKRILASMLGTMFPDDVNDESLMELSSDPLYEENAVFVLELAARLLVSNRGHSAELLPLFVSKFEVLFSGRGKDDDNTAVIGLSFPYLLERIIVTILRAAIHLYDIPDRGIRIHLVRLIELVCRLPYSYTQEISSRLGCGAAIVLRGCFLLFESTEEWVTMRNLLDIAAQHQSGRNFVFDGISSLIEFVFPALVDEDGEPTLSNSVELSQDGVEAIRYLLLKFLEGSYENDLTYKLPSIMYIKRVYSRQNSSLDMLASDTVAPENAHEQGTEWAKMISVIYNDVCLSEDHKASKKGFESLYEVIQSSNMHLIPHDQRLALIEMACTNPPTLKHASRIDSLILIGRLFLTLMPELSNQKENWAQLEDFTIEVTKMVRENLRSGRSTPLFEMTVHTVTNMINVMSMASFNDGQGINFCSWVGETLLCELLQVGACGGVDASLVAAAGSTNNH